MPRADEAADPRVRADKSGGPTPRGLGQGNHPSQDSIGKLVHPSVRPESSVPLRRRTAKSSQDSLSVASLRFPDNEHSGFQSPGLTSSHAVADGMAERWPASWPDVSPVPIPPPQAITGRRLIRFESEDGQIKKNAPGGIRTPNPRFRRPMLYPIELQVRWMGSLSGDPGRVNRPLARTSQWVSEPNSRLRRTDAMFDGSRRAGPAG